MERRPEEEALLELVRVRRAEAPALGPAMLPALLPPAAASRGVRRAANRVAALAKTILNADLLLRNSGLSFERDRDGNEDEDEKITLLLRACEPSMPIGIVERCAAQNSVWDLYVGGKLLCPSASFRVLGSTLGYELRKKSRGKIKERNCPRGKERKPRRGQCIIGHRAWSFQPTTSHLAFSLTLDPHLLGADTEVEKRRIQQA